MFNQVMFKVIIIVMVIVIIIVIVNGYGGDGFYDDDDGDGDILEQAYTSNVIDYEVVRGRYLYVSTCIYNWQNFHYNCVY